MICATKKCIGNDVDKIQDIDNVPQERVLTGGEDIQNTLIFMKLESRR